MKTIVVSDTALAGVSYEDTLRGIYTLKKMQEDGNKIIVLTNDPDYSICQIGGNAIPSYRMNFQDYSNISRKDPGIDIILYNHGEIMNDIEIKPNYTVVGNGIEILDSDDIIIHSEKSIDTDTLQNMEDIFHQFGYSSLVENKPNIEVGLDEELTNEDYEKAKMIDRYKFFTPKRVLKEKNDQVYAVVCDSRVSFLDGILIGEIESANKGIKGCIVDNRPYFYQEEINKLKAFRHILQRDPNINLEETYFILDSATDGVIMGSYPENSYCLNDRIVTSKRVKTERTLSKVLDRIR